MKFRSTLLLPFLLLAGATGLLHSAGGPLAGAPAAAPAAFKIDPAHSWILFKVNHLGIGTAWGSFVRFGGSFQLDPDAPAASSVEVTIEADSVSTNNAKRDEHLRSQDFFNVREFSEIRFRSTRVAADGDGFAVTGTLELLGQEHEVTAHVTKVGEGQDPWGNQRAGFEGRLVVDRTAFGMDFMKDGLGTQVEVLLAIEATRG